MRATWEGSFNLLLGPRNNGALESLVFITLHLQDLEPCVCFSPYRFSDLQQEQHLS